MSKANIIKDFEKKQKSYYQNNYLNTSKATYLRKLRNELIKKELNQIKILENVLDVGCGPAILFEETLERTSNYYALDIVETNLKQIEETNMDNKKIYPILSDIDSFSFETEFFDAIIISGSIEYTDFPIENLKKLTTYLKKDGVLICSFPNKWSFHRQFDNLIYRKIKFIVDKFRKRKVISYDRKLFSEKELLNSLKQTKFEIRSRFFGMKLILSPFDYFFSNLDYYILKKYEEKKMSFLRKISSEYLLIVKKINVD
jgi:SAM-dependent methyltransferase